MAITLRKLLWVHEQWMRALACDEQRWRVGADSKAREVREIGCGEQERGGR